MMGKFRWLFIGFLAVAFVATGIVFVDDASAVKKKSQAELDAAKKEGDLSTSDAMKHRDAYGREADAANVESFEYGTTLEGVGDSTYGVKGYDYLTGIGKAASDPTRINEKTFKIKAAFKTPLEKLMKKRFKNKWTGQHDDSYSGWGEKSGITEAWMRNDKVTDLGASYNGWVNQWNDVTRPQGHAGQTQVAGADPDQGAHWFSFYCVHCHGWNGKGDGPTAGMLDPRPRNQTNGKYMNFVSNLDLFSVIKGGGIARNLSNAMPPWGNVLQDQDIWNVVAFLRSLATPAFVPDADDVTAANAAGSDAFKEMQEELELPGIMAGRGTNQGGFSSIGGGRLSSMSTGIGGQKTSGGGGENSYVQGDWAKTDTTQKNIAISAPTPTDFSIK